MRRAVEYIVMFYHIGYSVIECSKYVRLSFHIKFSVLFMRHDAMAFYIAIFASYTTSPVMCK